MSVVVVGQIGRDLVLQTDGMPEPGGAAAIVQRRRLLGAREPTRRSGCANWVFPWRSSSSAMTTKAARCCGTRSPTEST
ncbi:MAG: hypothetical protein ACSLE6_13070 [Mycobacterium sp.]